MHNRIKKKLPIKYNLYLWKYYDARNQRQKKQCVYNCAYHFILVKTW